MLDCNVTFIYIILICVKTTVPFFPAVIFYFLLLLFNFAYLIFFCFFSPLRIFRLKFYIDNFFCSCYFFVFLLQYCTSLNAKQGASNSKTYVLNGTPCQYASFPPICVYHHFVCIVEVRIIGKWTSLSRSLAKQKEQKREVEVIKTYHFTFPIFWFLLIELKKSFESNQN